MEAPRWGGVSRGGHYSNRPGWSIRIAASPLEFETQSGHHRVFIDIDVIEVVLVEKGEETIADIDGNVLIDIDADAAHQRGRKRAVVKIVVEETVTEAPADIGLDHGTERQIEIDIGRGGV